ncbi:hypothetical protein K438DRAFT_1585189, partial [Mycena galopus ATCC 62051]
DGRRRPFVAVTAGVSYGTGQRRPGVLLNTKANAVICAAMVAHWAIQRIAGFSNGPRPRSPSILQATDACPLCGCSIPHPSLPRDCLGFATCTFNFGPRTVTFPHIDAPNLAWGWCSITTLGQFNPDLGGHLILWDLNLVIRFPPGSTIMIPSALLRHSNVSIQQNEMRYSFTQYTAGRFTTGITPTRIFLQPLGQRIYSSGRRSGHSAGRTGSRCLRCARKVQYLMYLNK